MGYASIAEQKISDDDIREITILYQSGVSMRQLGRDFGVSHRSIGYRLRKNTIDKNNNIVPVNRVKRGSKVSGTGKFKWDEFEKHSEHEKAYWAGFITADGYVNKNTIRIEISNKDADHLEWWRQFNATIKNNKRRQSCSMSATHPDLVKWAQNWGIYQCKTGKEIFPAYKPDSLVLSWIRGVFDGDGWFSMPKPNNVLVGGICSASWDFLEGIQKFLYTYNIDSKLRSFYVADKLPHHKLMFYQRMSFRLSELVGGHPNLARKWDKVEEARKKSKAMSDSTIELIYKLRRKGMTHRGIATEIGYSYSAVKYRLAQGGVLSVTPA